MAWFTVSAAPLSWTVGILAACSSSPGAARHLYGKCGTSLTYEAKAYEIYTMMGSIDDPATVPPRDHTQADGRLAWDVIADGPPAYPRAR